MKHFFWKIGKNERGVSFAETLISLLLLSLVMAALFRMGTTLLPRFQQEKDLMTSDRNKIMLYRRLTQLMKEVSPQWWLSQYSPEEESGNWTFSYFRGNETLELQFSEESIIIMEGGRSHRIPAGSEDNIHGYWLERPNGPGIFCIEWNEQPLYFPLSSGVMEARAQ